MSDGLKIRDVHKEGGRWCHQLKGRKKKLNTGERRIAVKKGQADFWERNLPSSITARGRGSRRLKDDLGGHAGGPGFPLGNWGKDRDPQASGRGWGGGVNTTEKTRG